MIDPTRFFVTGGTLALDAPSYVERQADAALFEGLSRSDFCYVLTPRQMGKSSLMVRTAARLRESGVTVAILDLTMVGQLLTQEQWYYGLLQALGSQLRLREPLKRFWLENPLLGPLQRWMAALREVVIPSMNDERGTMNDEAEPGSDTHRSSLIAHRSRLVIFVDEIDAVRSLPFNTDELFAAIRECYNRRPHDPVMHCLTFCLVGVATPSDLIQDPRTTPFNIGVRVELEDFTDTEAAPLTAGLVVGRAESFGRSPDEAREILRRILYWTSGHPYLTQRLCQAMVETPTERGVGGVDRVCEELFLAPGARERDDNLILVRERILRAEGDLGGILELYSRVWRGRRVKDDTLQPAVGTLRLSGIVKAAGRNLAVRNRIYAQAFDREWIREVMPGGELRRQRTAYRQGMLRAVVVLGALLTALAASFFGLQQFKRAEQRGRALRVSRYVADMGAAEAALRSGDSGRAQVFLDRYRLQPNQEDLRGFEWRYLTALAQRKPLTLKPPLGLAMSLHFLPDSHTLVAADARYRFDYLDVRAGAPTRSVEAPENLQRLSRASGFFHLQDPAFSADGTRVTRCYGLNHRNDAGHLTGDWTVEIADPAGGSVKTVCRFAGYPGNSPVLSPDARLLALCYADVERLHSNVAFLELWDVAKPRLLTRVRLPEKSATSPVFSPDGSRLAVRAEGGVVHVWEVGATGLSPRSLDLAGHHSEATSLAFSPDSRLLAVGSGTRRGSGERPGLITLWEIRSRRPVGSLAGHEASVSRLAFTPNGRLLVSTGRDRSLKIWDARRMLELEALDRLPGEAFALAVSPDSQRLAVTPGTSPLHVFDLAPYWKRPAPRPTRLPIRAVYFTQDESLQLPVRLPADLHRVASENVLASSAAALTWKHLPSVGLAAVRAEASGKRLVLRDLQGRRLHSLTLPSELYARPVLRADGSEIVVGGRDGRVLSVDPRSGALRNIHRLPSQVRQIALSPDQGMAFLSSTGRLEVMTAAGSGATVVRSQGAAQPVAFSRDSSRLLFRDSGALVLRDLRLGSEVRFPIPQDIPDDTAGMVAALCPDNRTVAIAYAPDRKVRLLQVRSATEVAAIRPLPAEVSSLDFNSEGTRLAIGCVDGSVVLIPPAP